MTRMIVRKVPTTLLLLLSYKGLYCCDCQEHKMAGVSTTILVMFYIGTTCTVMKD